MAETTKLEARSREKTSKGAVRSLRREGRVPAVIYGDKKSPILIDLSYKEVSKLYHTGTFLSHTLDIEVDGKKEHVIPRDVQLEPVRDFIIHVDFLRLGKNATITVAIPVHFINEEASPGLKAGGVLNVVRHEVELVCPASAIPESIEIDLAGNPSRVVVASELRDRPDAGASRRPPRCAARRRRRRRCRRRR